VLLLTLRTGPHHHRHSRSTITQQFNSFGDIAWYEAGFLLPFCLLQLALGRVYQYYSVKWVMIASILVFEIGSIVCTSALNSTALIVRRVITGTGGVAVPPGSLLLIGFLVPPPDRPKYFGSLGSVLGISSSLGPVLGGALTLVSWRWCFWVNLPLGFLSVVLIALLTPKCPPPVKRASTWSNKLVEPDPSSFFLIGTSLVCLLLAIQFGGKKYSSSSGVVIALFVMAGVFGVSFSSASPYCAAREVLFRLASSRSAAFWPVR
jgi:MFS family permease